MEFDHLPGTTKHSDVATLVVRGCTQLAYAEVLKCELVCANCHAVRTYERREAARAGRQSPLAFAQMSSARSPATISTTPSSA